MDSIWLVSWLVVAAVLVGMVANGVRIFSELMLEEDE
jgi:hypothetical protein